MSYPASRNSEVVLTTVTERCSSSFRQQRAVSALLKVLLSPQLSAVVDVECLLGNLCLSQTAFLGSILYPVNIVPEWGYF